jgi:glycolate oxidase iron-sulfur subunit
MLTGCVQQVFFPQVNTATARVLAAEGCDVIIPGGQGCCGALSLHSGRVSEAAGFARRTIATFEQAGVDAIVVNSAGCGSAMKEYGALLADPPGAGHDGAGQDGTVDGWAARAAAISGKVRDLSEFLAELYVQSGGPQAARHELPVRVAYHDACHLAHAQRIRQQPRDLLQAIPGWSWPKWATARRAAARRACTTCCSRRPRASSGAEGSRGPGDRGGPGRVRQSRLQPADRGRAGRPPMAPRPPWRTSPMSLTRPSAAGPPQH